VLAKLDKVTSTGAGCATPLAILILCAVVLYLNYHACPAGDPASAPVPAPNAPPDAAVTPALTTALKTYHIGQGAAFKTTGERIRTGTLKTKAEIAADLAAHARPLTTQLDATTSAYCDPSGNVTNAAGLAREFAQAAQAIGAR
jgi:hypothetical protein